MATMLQFPDPEPVQNNVCCRSRFLLWAFLLIIGLLPQAAYARSIRVGISHNPPKIFIDDEGNPAGIYVDILSHIATQEDWDIEYVPGEWDQLLHKTLSAEIDLMTDLAYTSDRAEIFSFHEVPVLFSWSQIYTRKGLKIQAITDLDGYRIAVLKNSIQASSLANMIAGFGMDTDLLYTDSFDEAMAMVQNDQADATATNSYYGRFHARKYGLEDSPVVFEPSSLYFATGKNRDPGLLKTIDDYLKKLKSTPNSAYYQSLRRWSLENKPYRIPSWIWFGLGSLSVLLVMILIWWFVLKHQVKLRTRELIEANLEMEKRVEERTEELNMALQQARVADMLKSAFLATMSHELRTPLNSIIGFTGILLQELPGHINEEQRKQLQIVQTSSRHLLSLINDVLDISKIEAGQLVLKTTNIKLYDTFTKLLGSLQIQAQSKGVELELICDEGLDCFETDERRFEQIILNLLSNAIKFTEKGKVSLICELQERELKISVRDTGIGISREDQAKLFTPFRQLDSGLTRRYEGSGLGLSISKKIAKLMGGDIELESEPGKGSTFIVRLPLQHGEEI